MKNIIYKSLYISLCFMLVSSLIFTDSANAADGYTPFFAGDTGNPNVLLIFDNSDSMQDVPYLKSTGEPVRPYKWYWRQGVTLNEDETIKEQETDGSPNGDPLLDETKYSDSYDEVELPSLSVPNLPDVGSTKSEFTTHDEGSNRIYDTDIDWSDSLMSNGDTWAKNYKRRAVKIEDANGSNFQWRTIDSRNFSGQYWTFYGDPIDYQYAQPYKYTILSEGPGACTWPRTDSSWHRRFIYAANIDWSVIDEDYFNNNLKGRALEITDGTNKGEIRKIDHWDPGSKYLRVSSPFSQPCDFTTRFKITMAAGGEYNERQASGGNHPDSKLYQAKQALKAFLESNAIKPADEYIMNIAFATYMSRRLPRVTANYYRLTPANPERIREYYWRMADSGKYFYHNNSTATFTASDDWMTAASGSTDWEYNRVHTCVAVGYKFDRLLYAGDCREQIVHYTVYAIVNSPTDSQPDRKRFYVRSRIGYPDEGGYKYYTWRYFPTTEYTCDTLPADHVYTDADGYEWTRVPETHACNKACTIINATSQYYRTNYYNTSGDWNETAPQTARYFYRNDADAAYTGGVTGRKYNTENVYHTEPYPGWSEENEWRETNPTLANGDWVLVTPTIAAGLTDVPLNSDGSVTGPVYCDIYDSDYFKYPGRGTTTRPHAWSYRRTTYSSNDYMNYWGDDQQKTPFFPAEYGSETSKMLGNLSGDDQVIFLNLPEYNSLTTAKGDDITGTNVNKILSDYLNLTPLPANKGSNLYQTMMPYTSSLPVNTYQYSAGKGTPLAATLENAKTYYQSYFDSPDGYTLGGCRDNYIILLTDGLDTCAEGDTQAARNEKVVAAAESLFGMTPPIKTYVIGFGMDDNSKGYLNAVAAAGGTSNAYFATNVEQLVNVLTEEITNDIVGDSYTRSPPVLTRLQEGDTIEDDLKIFYAYFDYPVWKGHLKGYKINSNGSIGDQVPGWTSDCDTEAGPDADAGCEIASNGRGTPIYTVISGSRTEFSSANLTALKPFVNPSGTDIDGNGTTEDADAEAVIGYTLNPGYQNAAHPEYLGTRDEAWPLGDIYHSAPVVVTRPKFDTDYKAGYTAFKNANLARETMLYVGANDGMLHAFHESSGQEAWAWIPNSVLGTLYEFKDGHRFTVDLVIKAADVNIGTDDTPDWRTMIVSGLRQGGNHYFAIDVTDPSNPLHMWEMTDDNATDSSAAEFPGADIPGEMGQTWSIPAFGRININGAPTSVIFMGGGYSTTENKGNRIYILEAATGGILKEIDVGGPTNNVPSEIRNMRYITQGEEPVDYLTKMLVDSNLRGFIEVSYFGGTDGTLYKLTGLNADSGWNPQVETLYVPENPRPIYYRPAVSDLKCDSSGRRFILFGTGDENDPTNDASRDYFYEIEDRAYDDALGGFDSGSPCDAGQIAAGRFRLAWQYWHFEDPNDPESAHINGFPLAEKVLSYPTAYRGVVYFTTYQSAGGCDMGNSYLYGLTTSGCRAQPDNVECGGYSDAGGKGGLEYDVDGIKLTPHKKFIDLGKGIASSPVIGPPMLYVQLPKGSGDGMSPPTAVPVPTDPGKLIYWNDIN